ncbi:PAS domain-containing protein [bacterium]|nr:PAS domain-containing protein [bacterium]
MTRRSIIGDIEELRKNAERFRVAAICASDLTYEWNGKTGHMEWSGDIEKALGIKNRDFPEDITGWLNLIHPDDREMVVSTVENQIKCGGSIYLECRIKHKTRKWVDFKCRGRTIEGDDGKPEKLIGTCTDVTDSKKTVKHLLKSEVKNRL